MNAAVHLIFHNVPHRAVPEGSTACLTRERLKASVGVKGLTVVLKVDTYLYECVDGQTGHVQFHTDCVVTAGGVHLYRVTVLRVGHHSVATESAEY